MKYCGAYLMAILVGKRAQALQISRLSWSLWALSSMRRLQSGWSQNSKERLCMRSLQPAKRSWWDLAVVEEEVRLSQQLQEERAQLHRPRKRRKSKKRRKKRMWILICLAEESEAAVGLWSELAEDESME